MWESGDRTALAVVDKDGRFGIGIASPVRQLHIRGSNAVARLDLNVDSASFIFVRTSTDFSQVWKTFTFGVKATGVDTGSFFIGDMHTNASGSSDNRLLIDTSGNVGIGTTTLREVGACKGTTREIVGSNPTPSFDLSKPSGNFLRELFYPI
jgi:hypothetical protein